MESKSETTSPSSALVSDERSALLREIIGILLGIAGVIVFLALLAASRQVHWIGPVGDRVAETLFFILGQYVAFVLPVLLCVCALYALCEPSRLGFRGHSWLRGLGGLLILISACALLTLSAPAPARGARHGGRGGVERTRSAYSAPPVDDGAAPARSAASAALSIAHARGGLVGDILVDPEGVNISSLFGPMGAYAIFCGLILIGIVLFTETLLRDLARILLGSAKRAVATGVNADWSEMIPRPSFPGAPFFSAIGRFFRFLRNLHPIDRLIEFMRGVSFGRRNSARIMRTGPILNLTPARPASPAVPYDEEVDEPYPDKRRSSQAIFPRRPRSEDPLFSIEVDDEEASATDTLEPAYDNYVDDTYMDEPECEPAPLPLLRPSRKRERPDPVQHEMNLFPSEFQLPSLNLLLDPPAGLYIMSPEEQERLSRQIEQTLAQFKIEVEVIEVIQGPVITRFAMRVAPGVRVNKILALESELAMALKAQHVRILAPIPGQSAVGIEVPNKRSNPVVLKDLLDNDTFRNSKSPLSFALGKNISGEPVICDLAQMPHLLIAGATGAGKSVCLNAIIASLLYRNKPDRVKFVMVDPKRVELSIYQAIPHLIAPVVSETKKAAAALAWCVEQMESRYKTLAEIGVRNLDSYNALLNEKVPNKKLFGRGDLKFLPHIVIIIDELADLMMVAKNEVEEYIIRLAQMARAVGMHLVLATQRPSVNVITGIIKANFPSRIAFQVSSKVDSRTILDMNGAEALMGRGDMLYSPGGAKPFRIQGAFVSDGEVERLADYIRAQEKARYEKEDFEIKPTPAERAKAQLQADEDPDSDSGLDEGFERREPRTIQLEGLAVHGRAGSAPLTPADMDTLSDQDLYDMALKLILESRKASVSYIQRRMKIGYARAGRIMDLLEEQGIVGPYQGSKPRDLLVDPDEYRASQGGEDE